jgi:prevent-host-death family protein
MTTVGVRELRNRLSEYLRRVKAGERLIVTERGRPVAVLSAPADGSLERELEEMLRTGLARWGGGKPRGAARPPRNRGASVADAIREDRG